MMTNEQKWFDDHLAEHVLEPCDQVKSYYIKRPGTRMMSSLVTFSPEGIAIQGDLTPEHQGSISALGYGEGWFSGELSRSYLAEKFLTRRWLGEVAAEWLREELLETEGLSDSDREEIEDLAKCCEDGGCNEHEFYEQASDIGFCMDDSPGWGYDPGELGWLVAIQKAFRRLKMSQDMKENMYPPDLRVKR